MRVLRLTLSGRTNSALCCWIRTALYIFGEHQMPPIIASFSSTRLQSSSTQALEGGRALLRALRGRGDLESLVAGCCVHRQRP
eukprot:scaffold7508_cov267-Pinguiococcus_pyrenoidosus.AAC.3